MSVTAPTITLNDVWRGEPSTVTKHCNTELPMGITAPIITIAQNRLTIGSISSSEQSARDMPSMYSVPKRENSSPTASTAHMVTV